MRTEFRTSPPNERISDHFACPQCVRECRERPFADDYVTYNAQLWGYCLKHRLRWYVTREMGGYPDVSRRPAILLRGFAQVEPVYRLPQPGPPVEPARGP